MRMRPRTSTALLWRRDGASYEGISSIHLVGGPPVDGAKKRVGPPTGGIQKTSGRESPQTRAETEGCYAFRRRPRRGRFKVSQLGKVRSVRLADQVLIQQTLSDDFTDHA